MWPFRRPHRPELLGLTFGVGVCDHQITELLVRAAELNATGLQFPESRLTSVGLTALSRFKGLKLLSITACEFGDQDLLTLAPMRAFKNCA